MFSSIIVIAALAVSLSLSAKLITEGPFATGPPCCQDDFDNCADYGVAGCFVIKQKPTCVSTTPYCTENCGDYQYRYLESLLVQLVGEYKESVTNKPTVTIPAFASAATNQLINIHHVNLANPEQERSVAHVSRTLVAGEGKRTDKTIRMVDNQNLNSHVIHSRF